MTVSADVTEEGGTSSTVTQGAELNKSFNAVITMQGIILCLSEEKENPNSTNDEVLMFTYSNINYVYKCLPVVSLSFSFPIDTLVFFILSKIYNQVKFYLFLNLY